MGSYTICHFLHLAYFPWASLVAQRLKRLPGMRETWFRSLGREDPLEREMATHSSTLAWRIPWREKPGRLTFRSLIHVELIFLMFCEKIVLISFTCSCAVFLAPLIKETVFPVVYSYLLCHRLIDDKYLGLFLSFLVCSRDLCACF